MLAGVPAGTSRVVINGTEVADISGHTFSGWSAPTIDVTLGNSYDSTVIDELKIYGVGA